MNVTFHITIGNVSSYKLRLLKQIKPIGMCKRITNMGLYKDVTLYKTNA